MTSTSATSVRRFAYRNGNPALECGAARLRAQCRQLATVVTIDGTVDETNVDRLGHHIKPYVLAEKPLVLDLGGVQDVAPAAVTLLSFVEQTCRATGVDWSLVASEPVKQTLSGCGDQIAFAVTDSVPEALDYFLEDLVARRRLLPLLNKSA